VFWRNWQASGEGKLMSKEVEGMLRLSTLTRVCLVVKLAWAVAESSLFIPAIVNRFSDNSICKN